ncbi:mucin-5B-like [Tiliqua scincoides]|uniref:mucin-5B-like n=1 Tax=Tiliqua scincoides TaxID=71010 RepID=UPI0034631B37
MPQGAHQIRRRSWEEEAEKAKSVILETNSSRSQDCPEMTHLPQSQTSATGMLTKAVSFPGLPTAADLAEYDPLLQLDIIDQDLVQEALTTFKAMPNQEQKKIIGNLDVVRQQLLQSIEEDRMQVCPASQCGLPNTVCVEALVHCLEVIPVQRTTSSDSLQQLAASGCYLEQRVGGMQSPLQPEDNAPFRHSVQRPAVTTSECSTWGNFHFQTFDHVKFNFPGTCHYIFASHCNDNHQDFNIQIKRDIKNGNAVSFAATIDGVLLEVKESGTTVNGKKIRLPFSLKNVLIEDISVYLQVISKLGLTLKWNWGDTLLLDLEDTYKGKTCGLCGNYDGNGKNDLISNGNTLLPRQFGNLQKVEDPTEKCPDVLNEDSRKHHDNSQEQNKCKSRYKSHCKKVLSHFGNCPKVVAIDDYVGTCVEDMCNCPKKSSHSDLIASCVCSTFNQYSRDCVRKGGDPGKWRSKDFCFQKCSSNTEHTECGNPCTDTCSNPERSKICRGSCTDGCFCPEGTILDDLMGNKCIPASSCPCTFQGNVYSSGASYSIPCQNCTCVGGKWSCVTLPCSGNCNIEGALHITTFDKKHFHFHGNCHYVLAKDVDDSFAVIGEIVPCGVSHTMTCLKNVLITLGATSIGVCSCGDVYVNNVITMLPKTKDGTTIFRPSTFYVSIVTSSRVQIQVQLKPIMQLFITVDETYRNRTSGLCGNFNNVQTDDFQTISGIVEHSASAFGNSWKTAANCADVQDNFENPCLKSVDKEKFGQHWCALLSDAKGTFAKCHSVSDPAPYVKNCLYDICNAEKSEEALCSVLSAYARNCAANGVHLKDWRGDICDVTDCPRTMAYSYDVKYCNSSCRSLHKPDTLCSVQMVPVEGCGCPEGMYQATEEKCVLPEDCPCYYQGQMIQPGDSFKKDKFMCKCIQGQLDCTENTPRKDCPSSMFYVDCSSADPGLTGSECQKSCKTQDMQCYATECVSGCKCPDGLVSDDKGNCIEEEECPCIHGGNFYRSGTSITINCNTCTCHKRQWNCANNPCQGTCTLYGNRHYFSFDGAQFDFMGDCDYILTQDFCPNNPQPGTFRIVMQNIACGQSLSACSLKISVILEGSEIRLLEGKIEEIMSKPGLEKNYTLFLLGSNIIIETFHGMVIMWNQKTTVIVQVAPSFQGKVCGLCGNFDNRVNNDFTTRGQSLEMHAQAFGNSWKITSSCSDINKTDLCASQPVKLALGQKRCSIIRSDVFRPCHSKINPTPYYESCVSDFCGCDSVGDCEFFCTAVAAYSRSCSRAGICIDWRSPSNCPVFCDYHNLPNKRKWHYKPCGDPCLRTCRNPSGKCGNLLYSVEGCYPECNAEKPYYDEKKGDCVTVLECTSCDPKEKLCLKDSSGKISSPYVVSPAKRAMRISPCFCNANGGQIANGSRQFVAADIPGWCIYAFCNASCQIDFIYGACFLTTATTSNLSMTSSSPCKGNVQNCEKPSPPYSGVKHVPAFIQARDCTDRVPPRKFQEFWKFGRCQVATCLGGNHVKISDVHCPPQKLKLCVNGLPLVKNHNASHCCGSLECQCACSGWGNQHFITFDGSYYNFRGNCTYLLVKPIRPDSNSFWIHMDNHYCAAAEKAVCSMSLFIFYNHSTVTLTQGVENGKEINLVLFNNRKISPSFSNDGIDITTAGLYVMVTIPEIGLYVTYTLLAFHINLPFSTFYNNTEGQCGTCTNKKADDAMKRNGEMASSFTEMAMDWKVMNLARSCDPIPSLARLQPFGFCLGPSLCHLIWTFTECHSAVPPRPYYDACVMDGCSFPRQCKNLQIYAAMCGFHGICLDWRSKTNKTCALTCSQDQIYKPCGRMERPGCYSGQKAISTSAQQGHILKVILVEGCFCPDGMIQMNRHDSACVSICGCTGPDGLLKKPGESWEKDCQICTCSKEMLTISCSPHICAKSPPITCTKEGFVPIVRPHPEDPCCMATICECDVRSCTIATKKCNLGFQPVRATSEEECCPIYSCRPKGVCVSNGLEYQPRSLVQSDSCEECLCTETQDPKAQTNQIKCTPIQCSTECQPGFHYFPEEGKCCGQCVQVACTAQFPSGIVTIKDGDTYVHPQDNCTRYNCSRLSGQFVLMSTVTACPAFDQGNCDPGTIEMSADGCCQTCLPLSHNCEVKLRKRLVVYKKCKSATPVSIPSCEGSCSTYSMYSFDTHKMKHKCTCCHATKYHEERAELICSRRKRMKYTYLHVDECSCVEATCST